MMVNIKRFSVFSPALAALPVLLFLLAAGVTPARAESAASLARRGNDLFQHERYKEAADAYRQALERDPTSTILQYNYGTALAQQRQTDDAAQALKQAAQAPGSAVRRDSFYNLGTALADSTQPTTGSAQTALGSVQVAPGLAQAAPGSATAAPGSVPMVPGLAPAPMAPGSAQSAPGALGGDDLKQKIARLEQSLGAFRETILTDPKDDPAKYNYEVVQALLKRLKEQQQKQQQSCPKGQPDKNQKDPKDQKDKDQQKQDQQNQQQQNQDKQNQDQQQKSQNGQDPKQQNQAQQNQGLQQKKPQSGQGQPEPQDSQQAQSGSAPSGGADQSQKQPLTQEQMDAMRLLNLLEKDKPEQFKQLFRFQGKRQEREPLKDW